MDVDLHYPYTNVPKIIIFLFDKDVRRVDVFTRNLRVLPLRTSIVTYIYYSSCVIVEEHLEKKFNFIL